MKRTLLVGLDAACWEYLDPLLKSGRLPAIQKLIDTGYRGTLTSTMPPWTPTAWSSLVTAKNPGKHGIFDMFWRRPGSYDFALTNATIRRGTPFWAYLNDAGVRVGLVNVPFTHPPVAIDGFILCGFGTPESAGDLTWPPEALASIEAGYGKYRPIVSTETLRSGMADRILATEKNHQAGQIAIAAELAEQYAVDVLVINLMLTDHANHKVPEMAQVQAAYEQSDSDIASLISAFGPDNVMLISDHGSSRLKGDFLLNVWLRDHGYSTYLERTPAEQKAAFIGSLRQWSQDYKGWSGTGGRLFRRLVRDILPGMPDAFQARYWSMVERAIPHARTHVLYSTEPDYTRTKVFPGSLYSGLLYFNVAGREPAGVVDPLERRELAAELKRELLQVVEPDTGRPLFAEIFLSDDLYEGQATADAPDLIVDAYHSSWNIRTRQPAPYPGTSHGRYFVTFDHSRDFGWHSRDGVFVFAGTDFRSGTASSKCELMDIPATLIHLYDVPQPDDWDGTVMVDTLANDGRRRPPATQPGDAAPPSSARELAYTAEEADSMIRHLRALGYLD